MRRLTCWGTLLALLVGFGVLLFGSQQASLWHDEAWSAWTVHDNAPEPDGLRETIRLVRDSVANTIQRVRNDDVHPPLYYLLLDGWTLIFGESELMLRLPSVLAALLTLACTFAIGKRLLDAPSGLLALLWLLPLGSFVYYAREARMYAPLLALTTLAVLAYLHWSQRRTWWRGLLLGICGALLLWTHYLGVLVIAVLSVHGAFFGATAHQPIDAEAKRPPRRPLIAFLLALLRRLWPLMIAAALFAPWLPQALYQLRLNPYTAAPIPTDWGAVWGLVLALTAGVPMLYGLLLLAGVGAWRHIPRHTLTLVLLWLLLPPLILFVVNVVTPIYQVRYLTIIAPAWALLLAIAVRYAANGLDRFGIRPYVRVALMALIALHGARQLSTLDAYWLPKPPWDAVIAQAAAARPAAAAAVVLYQDHSPTAYYDRQHNLTDGISIDVGWRRFEPPELQEIVSKLDNVPETWAFVPGTDPSGWDVLLRMAQNRGVSYRASLWGMLFYGFDAASDTPLNLRLGDWFAIDTPLGQHLTLNRDACTEVTLRALQATPDNLTISLYLTRHYADVVAQSHTALPALQADQRFSAEICATDDAWQGNFHLRLMVVDDTTGQRLPIIEGDAHRWADFAVVATVTMLP